MKQINDPVFGDLEYDECKEGWTKKIFLGIWFDDSYQLDLVVQCDKEGVITDVQRDAYKSYLANLQNVRKVFPEILLSYFKEHYEEFNRNLNLPYKLKIDVVELIAALGYFNPLQLFIDRKGNYGWLSGFISPINRISVILSEDTPKIFKDWMVLTKDYARVDDEVFGEMFFDQGWCKWIKTDINGIDGEWVVLEADAFISKQKITPEQKANYQKYLEKEKTFLSEYPKVLLKYYLLNYDVIKEVWDDADLFDKESMDEKRIKSLVQFQKLYFNMTGTRYGWLLKCAWDKVYGLSLYYDNKYDGICVGTRENLTI